MRDTIRLSLRLLLFTLVAALLLSATNEITKGPIAKRRMSYADAVRGQVLPGDNEFREVPVQNARTYPGILSVYEVVQNEQVVGHALLVESTGYKGAIVMTLAINASGSINALAINDHHETAGLGTKIAEQPFLSQFPGKAADPDVISHEVDAISGATASSRAVLGGVDQALRYARDELHIQPHAGEVVTQESVDAMHEIEARTGTAFAKPLTAFEASGFAELSELYKVVYEGEDAYLFFGVDQESCIVSTQGALLSPAGGEAVSEGAAAAVRYVKANLMGGGEGA